MAKWLNRNAFFRLFANNLVVKGVFWQFFTTKITTNSGYSLSILDYLKKENIDLMR